MAYRSTQSDLKPMLAIETLVSGKTDSELLQALVNCIIDNDRDLISALRDSTDYNDRTKANVEVLAAIVYCVNSRNTSELSTDLGA
jgi:hypothetical protein